MLKNFLNLIQLVQLSDFKSYYIIDSVKFEVLAHFFNFDTYHGIVKIKSLEGLKSQYHQL